MSQDDVPSTQTGTNDDPSQEISKDELLSKFGQLKAFATQQYALKNYAAAAESYSEAAEIQDQLNGEMSPENAELLYQYGRCLYHVGVSKSDVLGGKVAQQEEPKRKKRKIVKEETEIGNDEALKNTVSTTASSSTAPANPFFQITGDENWTDSEDEGDDADAEGEEEEDDDLAIAYEILDSARILFSRQVEAIDTTRTQDIKILKERLADTHDLQAEIKLENEQFTDAVHDARQALSYKLELFPQESGMIAEAHFKLSIALDFASLQKDMGEDEEASRKASEEMHEQAAVEMEKAILSCQARIEKEEKSLAELQDVKLEDGKRSIADARDLVKDMKNRLVELRNPLESAVESASMASGETALKGLLGEMLGQSKAEQVKMLAQATASANDLSGLVKQKKKAKTDIVSDESATTGNGKRKLETLLDERSDKRVKFED